MMKASVNWTISAAFAADIPMYWRCGMVTLLTATNAPPIENESALAFFGRMMPPSWWMPA